MGPYASRIAYWDTSAKWILAIMYLPCTAMVLSKANGRRCRRLTRRTGLHHRATPRTAPCAEREAERNAYGDGVVVTCASAAIASRRASTVQR
jgi:hypothetical protein